MISRKSAAALRPFTSALAVIQPHLQRRGTLAAVAQEMATARAALALRDAEPDAIAVAIRNSSVRYRLPR
jgi:hypothetical protein